MNIEKTIQARQTAKGLRIWLEGSALADHGFSHGNGYSVEYNANSIILWHDDGKRKVAGSINRPVIDLQSKKINTIFVEGMVQVDFTMGAIKITQG